MSRRLACLAVALAAVGCGAPATSPPAGRTTLERTLGDPHGNATLVPGPGEALRDRTDLRPAARPGRVLASFAQLTDAHLSDEESPARLEALDRLGAPFSSAFRPQEPLEPYVLSAAVRALNRLPLQGVVDTGDLVDSAQENELGQAVAILNGGTVDPNSGAPGYQGVQAPREADPLYYRPDLDAPRYPGLLDAAERRFRSPGLRAPWYPVAGNHDLLVGGIIAPTQRTEALATGDRRIVALPPGLRLSEPAGEELSSAATDGRPQAAALADRLLAEQRLGRTVPVTPDPRRRELDATTALTRLRAASRHGGAGPRLDYTFDLGPAVRGIALDAIRRPGGSGGELSPAQLAWLARALRGAGSRWVVVFSHQPLTSFPSGRDALALLDRDPHVVAAIAGHTHRNAVIPRRSPAGGYWLVTTASLVDYPQQTRTFRLRATATGGVALETFMVDTVPDRLADAARALAYVDAQGGRPGGFAGGRLDRNVRLYR